MENIWPYIPVVMIILSTLALMLFQNWRWTITALAVQYLAEFLLVVLVLPTGLAAVKLVAGWMAGAVLASSQATALVQEDELSGHSGRVFRLLISALVWILAVSITPGVSVIVPVVTPYLAGGLILLGMGLLQLSMTTQSERVIIGLLTVLSGFEVLYAAVENSVLVIGLLAAVNMILALVGAYLQAVPSLEEPE